MVKKNGNLCYKRLKVSSPEVQLVIDNSYYNQQLQKYITHMLLQTIILILEIENIVSRNNNHINKGILLFHFTEDVKNNLLKTGLEIINISTLT